MHAYNETSPVGVGGAHPLCFLHLPKCAGTSVIDSLKRAFPRDAVSPQRLDRFVFCGFSEFDQLGPAARSLIAADDAEFATLAEREVVAGHYPLDKLLELAPAAGVATVVREPRARILSSYLFNRASKVLDIFGAFRKEVLEAAGPQLGALLSDARIARIYDNVICRYLLRDHPLIEDDEFIAAENVEAIAAAALEQIDRLGYVGVLETEDVWSGLSAFFGRPLRPLRRNVTGADWISPEALPLPPFEMREMLELLERRSAADHIVYETLLERRCGDRDVAKRITMAAFAEHLMRFGDLAGSSAAKLGEARSAVG